MSSKRVAILSLVSILILGFALGLLTEHFVLHSGKIHRPPKKSRDERLITTLTKELELTEEQQQQLKTLLQELKEKHDTINRSTRPEHQRVRQEFNEAFSKILTPEQAEKYEAFNKRLQEKYKKKREEQDNRRLTPKQERE
jgi:Spy/CpxP family protein refolding chaperone